MKSFKSSRMEQTQEEKRQYRRLQTQRSLVESLQRQLEDDREALQARNASLKLDKEKAREAQQKADAHRLQLKEAQTEASVISRSMALLEKAKKQKTPENAAIVDVLIDIHRKLISLLQPLYNSFLFYLLPWNWNTLVAS